jgi:membrane protein DedA with SNARE-associated domain
MTPSPDVPASGYVALFLVMLLAWAGFPVAGQGALIAAGVLASHDELRIEWVLAVGALGSAAGGMLGYWGGYHGGRGLRSDHGPLSRWRRQELARGERLVGRYAPLAVLLAPMWVSGVYRMRWRSFVKWDLISAIAWTVITGLGGYWIGPEIARAVGAVNAAILVGSAVIAGSVLTYIWRCHHERL